MTIEGHIYDAVEFARMIGKLDMYLHRALAAAISADVKSKDLPPLPTDPFHWPEPMHNVTAQLGFDAQMANDGEIEKTVREGISRTVSYWAGLCEGKRGAAETQSNVAKFPSRD